MLNDLWIRMRAIFRRKSIETELNDEIRFHFEAQVAQYVASGMPPDEATRRARLEFGGLEQVKEECRDARGVQFIETLAQDIRYGLRMLSKSPGFTTVAVLTLALGIGATTGIFSVIDSVLLRPLPYRDPGGLVLVWESSSHPVTPHNTVAPPDFLEWQTQNHSFAEMAFIFDERDNLTGSGEPEEVISQGVSANFFSVLGVNPILGTGFTAENAKPGHDDVVLLSYGLWKDRFGGDPAILGKTIFLNGHAQVVIGVAPQGFDWYIKDGSLTSQRPELWYPFPFPQRWSDRKQIGRFLTVVARLKPGVTAQAAQVEMNTIATRLEREYPDFNGHWGINVVPVRDQLFGDLRPALLTLFGAVVFVLLIACANVSSLLLARAAQREREMAVRVAIGASRGRVARQLLTESALLALLGGAAGVAVAILGSNALLAATPANLLNRPSIPVDWRLFAFAAAMTLFAGMLFGFLPSYLAANSGISEALKEGGRSSTMGERRRSARSVFVVAQTALALVLLTGSGLLIRSFVRLIQVDPGFEPSHLLAFKVSLPRAKYGTDPARLAFFQEFLVRIRQLPGVRSATMNSFPPLSGLGAATAVHIVGQPPKPESELPVADVRVVGPDYFRTMSIPLLAGRTFNEQELSQMRHVTVVNEAFVRQCLPGVNPLGQKVVIEMKGPEEDEKFPSEIIGVVGDVHETGPYTPPGPEVFWPHPELVYSGMTMLVRTSGDPLALASGVRSQLKQMDPDQPMSQVTTMDQLLSDSVSRSRFTALLLGLFAGIALLLAAVGTYGLISYNAAQRTHEMGVRIALGARPRDVLNLMLEQGARLIFLGIVIGVVAAWLLTRFMVTLLYSVRVTDPITFGMAAGVLSVAALLACYIPARRAMRVDPMVALRHE